MSDSKIAHPTRTHASDLLNEVNQRGQEKEKLPYYNLQLSPLFRNVMPYHTRKNAQVVPHL